ncbi:MAG: hypothetical protein IAF38_21695 [Bacteroidia bacterium]|nr:hypothetical protein [Bacteroidia bacterium]
MLHTTKIPLSYIFNKVKFDLLIVLFLSLLVNFLTRKFSSILPVIPITIPVFLGTSISILLSFKLNQSYDRWWEARKIWGSVVNDSRSLVLQLQTLFPKNNDEVIKKMALRQVGWCYALGESLRGKDPLKTMAEYLSPHDLASIKLHSNIPLALLQLHAKDIANLREEGKLNEFSFVQIDSTLVRLCESMGKAERIKSTVFPVTYRLFLHYIIYLFVITLSISLVDVEGYYEIPLLLGISSAFFLLEKSATHMQDPFDGKPTDTAMTTIARKIEINIRELLNEQNIPKPLAPENFYSI